MAGQVPEIGDAGTDSAAGPSLRPGSGAPLLPPAGAAVAPEADSEDGTQTVRVKDPHGWPQLVEAPLAPEPTAGDSRGIPPDGDTPSEGDAIHLEDDRV